MKKVFICSRYRADDTPRKVDHAAVITYRRHHT